MTDHPSKLARIEQLFREHFRPMVVLAMRYVKRQEIAEDIVQDIFMYLHDNNAPGEIEELSSNYLYRLVKFRCLNHLAHLSVRKKHDPEIEKVLHANPHDPLTITSRLELENAFLMALEDLTPSCKKVFELSRIRGQSNEEIASQLNLSKRTVETHISNALKTLRQALKAYLPVLLMIYLNLYMLLSTYMMPVTCY